VENESGDCDQLRGGIQSCEYVQSGSRYPRREAADNSGWKILDLFKNDLNFRHIPVYLISGEENRALAYKRGARNFLLKPLRNEDLELLFKDIERFRDKKQRTLLLVEDNEMDSSNIVKMLQNDDVKITIADTGQRRCNCLRKNPSTA
jgi:CheY-like chemotaxis protein